MRKTILLLMAFTMFALVVSAANTTMNDTEPDDIEDMPRINVTPEEPDNETDPPTGNDTPEEPDNETDSPTDNDTPTDNDSAPETNETDNSTDQSNPDEGDESERDPDLDEEDSAIEDPCGGCDDNDPCTEDRCVEGRCVHENTCEEIYDFRSMLLNEQPGVSFSVSTDKRSYSSDEEVFALIEAPEDASVELAWNHDDYMHYIKIPDSKSFPLKLSLPIPRSIQEGIYTLSAAIYHNNMVIKSKSDFEIEEQPDIRRGMPDEETKIKKVESSVMSDATDVAEDVPELDSEIEVGKPVIWKKRLNLESGESIDQIKKQYPGVKIVSSTRLDDKQIGTASSYLVRLQTPPPDMVEHEAEKNGDIWNKKVIIRSDMHGDFEYRDVKGGTDIIETDKDNIRLFWIVDGERIDVTRSDNFDIDYLDTDGNRMIDRIEWVTPHLSEQEFEVEIVLTPSKGEGMEVTLIEPIDIHLNNQSNIKFRFLAAYNKSLNLSCQVIVDETVMRNITSDGDEETQILNKSLDEGEHQWEVSCTDSQNNTALSPKRSFVTDYTPPQIEITNQETDVSLTDFINLSFIAEDTYSDNLDCRLLVINETSIQVNATSGSEVVNTLYELQNGTYSWNVICNDTAGNTGNSGTYDFHINKESTFRIEPHKQTYSLGENGVFVIEAPYRSKITLLIEGPEGSETRQYQDVFPIVDEFDTFRKPGTYHLYGFMNYEGAVKKFNTSFEVENTFSVAVDVDNKNYRKKVDIEFSADTDGGLGDVNYEWDFDDGNTAKGRTVKHKFTDYGTYSVRVKAKDKQGNTAEDKAVIRISEKEEVQILVLDSYHNISVGDAEVYLDNVKKSTSPEGIASFSAFDGSYKISVFKDGYMPNYKLMMVEGNTTEMIYIEPVDPMSVNLSNPVEEKENISEEQEETEQQEKEAQVKIDIGLDPKLERLEDLSVEEEDIAYLLGSDKEEAEKLLLKVQRDLHNLEMNHRRFNSSEIEDRKDTLKERAEDIFSGVVVDVHVMESEQFVQYPSQDIVSKVSDMFLEHKGIDPDDDYTQLNQELQDKMVVKTTYRKIESEMMSGETQDITLITHDIQQNDVLENKSFAVLLPDDMVIEKGEEAGPGLYVFEINRTGGQIVYSIEEHLSLEDAKSIGTVLLADKDDVKSAGIPFTSYAVFTAVEIEDPVLVAEIAVIVILIIVLLLYQFDMLSMIKPSKDRTKGLIKDIDKCLLDGETENAMEVYKELSREFGELPEKKRMKFRKDIMDRYEDILVSKVKDEADRGLAVAGKDKAQARDIYKNLQTYYKELPDTGKARVNSKCAELYSKLT